VAVVETVTDEANAGRTLRHMREMTAIAEHEMHTIVLTCKQMRRQALAGAAQRNGRRCIDQMDRCWRD
jgi:hypothetical protein